ncbi:hypothetical protein DACRYDRAFT_21204 [Dacryopinax primogenitus]|uniref:Uncharacterized protein n=1 Tax=Dacryopinax primogenitus (strain DJM 731) TaxID=1858805 RepID=M5GC90_DACPD|nr:uncharacterized protein DACRYDRAFT_21204 [Dacryopinax primogenitus]EJU03727.1 hypothetical protein DACRYDRAFT_21204 [Dacryopinax primogenitus]
MMRTLTPARDNAFPAINPAGPAPMIKTSHRDSFIITSFFGDAKGLDDGVSLCPG